LIENILKMNKRASRRDNMKVVRIDLQGACEPMEFESKKALKEYLIDFHLQDYHEEDEFGVEDIKLIKSFSLDQICDYFDWGYKQAKG
jgi:hypothetical protein